MNDPLVKGMWAGILGTIFGDDLIHWSAYFIFKTSTTCHYITGLMFHTKKTTDLMSLVSWFVHLIAGAIVGVSLILVLKRFGEDRAYIKGLGVGLIMWIVHVVIIPNLIASVQPYVLRTPAEAIVDLIAHIGWSMVATTVILKPFEKAKF